MSIDSPNSPDHKGTLVLWNDEKGFGFVRPEQPDRDLFIHISAIRNYQKGLSRRPSVGDPVVYKPAPLTKTDKKPKVSQATIPGLNQGLFGAENEQGPWWQSLGLRLLAGAPILLSFLLIWRTGNPIPLVSYIFMSALSSLYYADDKRRAMTNSWRVPEIYLHCFELMGGWPGALLAQKAFRHKNRKGRYRRVFWEIVILHCLIWVVYLYFELAPKH